MSYDEIRVLGEQVVGEMAQGVGFDWGGVLKGAAAAGATAIDEKSKDDAKKSTAADVQKAIEADANWANAEANLELAGSDATARSAAQVLRDSAKKASNAASAKLDSDGSLKRCKAANDALSDAASASGRAPKDIAKAAKMHAWQTVSSACGSSGSSDDDDDSDKGKKGKGKKGGDESWLTATHAGLPGYGWLGVGAVGLTAIGLIVRAMLKHKKKR